MKNIKCSNLFVNLEAEVYLLHTIYETITFFKGKKRYMSQYAVGNLNAEARSY
jgi:hypothetical protein